MRFSYRSLRSACTSIGLLILLILVLPACTPDEAPSSEPEAPLLALNPAVGSCSDCPLPPEMDGPLPSHLYPNSPWNEALGQCFEEDLKDVGKSCHYVPKNGTVTETISLYIQWGQCPTLSTNCLCTMLGVAGGQILDARPAVNYLLYDIGDVVFLWGSYYQVEVTWAKYYCDPMSALGGG